MALSPQELGPVRRVSPLQPLGHGLSAQCHNQLQRLDRLSWIPVLVEHDSLPRHSPPPGRTLLGNRRYFSGELA